MILLTLLHQTGENPRVDIFFLLTTGGVNFYIGNFLFQKAGSEGFVEKLNEICNSYFSFCESYGDPLSQAFHVIPYRELPKVESVSFAMPSYHVYTNE